MPSSSAAPDHYRRVLQPAFAGRRFLVIGVPALARELRALGAESVFLLESEAASRPSCDDFERCTVEAKGDTVMASWWDFERRLASPPADVQAAVDAWDPDARARAVGYVVLSALPSVAGRPRYAARPPEWLALEDKTRLHAFLDAAGVRRGPVAVVRAAPRALRAAHACLDRGAGTVWAGDLRPGVHGGAQFVRWVRSDAGAEEAEAYFAAHCARVRVMPFVEGVPCSIHGIVFDDAVAAFRPVELLVLRRPECGRLVYAGTATYWDPAPSHREALRALARRLGAALRERVGYRGPFTVDGVLGADGFVVTELNPRLGAGLFDLAGAVPELPLGALALAAQAGEVLDYRPAALEALVVERADASRAGTARLTWFGRRPEPDRCRVVDADGRYREARGGERSDGVLSVEPTAAGARIQLRPEPDRVPAGEPFAPRAAAALALADARWGLGIGPLQPARSVRRFPSAGSDR